MRDARAAGVLGEHPGGRGGETKAKLFATRAWLERSGLDAVLLTSQQGFAWITAGGHNHVSLGDAAGAGSVLVTRSDAYVLTDNIERPRLLDEELAGLPFEVVEHPWHDEDGERRLVSELCDTSRAVSDLGRGGLRLAPSGLAELRFVLSAPEIERYRALGRDAARAVESACRAAVPGEGELDVAARVAEGCTRLNILPLVNLVAADERIARYRHPLATDNRLRRTLFVALTGRRHGLHASLTRMVSFGPPNEMMSSRFAAVTRVDARVLLASTRGSSLGVAFAGLVEQYGREGLPEEWRLHHQGGLTGYAGREIFARPGHPHRLRPGNVLAWNPSITGAKSEDTIVLTDAGFEVLTSSGEWPETKASVPEGTVARPALLVRD